MGDEEPKAVFHTLPYTQTNVERSIIGRTLGDLVAKVLVLTGIRRWV